MQIWIYVVKWNGVSRLVAGMLLFVACLFGGALAPAAFCACLYVGIINNTARFDPQSASIQQLRVLKAIGLLHLPLLYLCIWSLGSGQLDLIECIFVFCAATIWFGQIADRAAHDLIRAGHRLGLIGQASLLTGHRVSAKRLLHDPQIGTPPDMSAPCLTETFWQYAMRLGRQEYSSGLSAETRKRRKHAHGLHPYLVYTLWTFTTLITSYALSGALGLGAMIALSVLVSGQSLLNEYVERFGLVRRILPNGQHEDFGRRHVWHPPKSTHTAIQHDEYASGQFPIWPYPRPKMLWTALLPTRWKTEMADRAAVWRIPANGSMDGFDFAGVTASSRALAGQAPDNLATWRHEMDSVLPVTQRAQRARNRSRHERD
ncbi:MAG: hypothetical protein ABJD13_20835 [Paracoccaceae bacterium]